MDAIKNKVKNIIFLIGYSGCGKDHTYESLKKTYPNKTFMRISGGDLVKKIATEKYNYTEKEKYNSRILLNTISNKYRFDKKLIDKDNIYSSFLSNEEFAIYNSKDSFWSYIMDRQINNADCDYYVITDLRFSKEIEYFMADARRDKYNLYVAHILTENMPSESDYEIPELVELLSSYEIHEMGLVKFFFHLHNFEKQNDQNRLFESQIQIMMNRIEDNKLLTIPEYRGECVSRGLSSEHGEFNCFKIQEHIENSNGNTVFDICLRNHYNILLKQFHLTGCFNDDVFSEEMKKDKVLNSNNYLILALQYCHYMLQYNDIKS